MTSHGNRESRSNSPKRSGAGLPRIPSGPRFFPREPLSRFPIADHHRPRWANICAGELGLDFTNCVHTTFELRGPLHLAALQESVRALVQRHSILSARVAGAPAGPEFVLDPHREASLDLVDFSHIDAGQRRAFAARAAGDLIWKPFASETEAWFRVFAMTLTANKHVIGFVVHHFICDLWSTRIMVNELLSLYKALATGLQPSLPELRLQYSDYVIGMNEWLRSGEADSTSAYWRDILRNAPPTRVPPDCLVAADRTGPIATQSSHLSPDSVAKLRRLGRSRGIAMSALIAAAMAAVVAHFSSSGDIVIVKRILGRRDPSLLCLVGAFFDSIALRISISMNATFNALASQVHRTLMQSYVHDNYPYQLVKSSLPQIGASDVAPMLNFSDAGTDDSPARKNSTLLRPFELPPRPVIMTSAGRYTGFNTRVSIDSRGLHIRAEYLGLLYSEATAARFVQTFCDLLQQASLLPERPLASLLKGISCTAP